MDFSQYIQQLKTITIKILYFINDGKTTDIFAI